VLLHAPYWGSTLHQQGVHCSVQISLVILQLFSKVPGSFGLSCCRPNMALL
jgi:hypothetical protein